MMKYKYIGDKPLSLYVKGSHMSLKNGDFIELREGDVKTRRMRQLLIQMNDEDITLQSLSEEIKMLKKILQTKEDKKE